MNVFIAIVYLVCNLFSFEIENKKNEFKDIDKVLQKMSSV